MTDIDFRPWQTGLRQPHAPKPHVMRMHGRWYLVDPPLGTWVQFAPITSDPREKGE